jgi:hypothetical protein
MDYDLERPPVGPRMSSSGLLPSAPLPTERGDVGIQLKAAVAIVREYGERLWRLLSKSGATFGDRLSTR